jgi:hypothetical protein
MRRFRAAVLATAVLLSACGGGGPSSDSRGVEKLAEQARADLISGQAHAFCGLLTPHGRARSLGFKVDFDRAAQLEPSDPRVPQTCPAVVRRELAAGRDPRVDRTWLDQLNGAKLAATHVEGDRARIEITPVGRDQAEGTVEAVRTPAGWRIDDADFIPSGH